MSYKVEKLELSNSVIKRYFFHIPNEATWAGNSVTYSTYTLCIILFTNNIRLIFNPLAIFVTFSLFLSQRSW